MRPAANLVTPRRFDLAAKYRWFRHILDGADPDSERIYRWHIEARRVANAELGIGMDRKISTDRYVSDSRRLAASMHNNGFMPGGAIPIDPDGELLGGAHRLACALALGFERVPVQCMNYRAWAPEWDEAWFIGNGLNADDLDRLRADMAGLQTNGCA